MGIISQFVKGAVSVITVTAAPQLYRYPYRTSSEGLRGDIQRVGDDIETVLGRLASSSGNRHGAEEHDKDGWNG